MNNKLEVQRCGFCGRYFKGTEFLNEEEASFYIYYNIDVPLGYCPDAQIEDYERNPEKYHYRVTRDMALDAGDPSLEGQSF